MVTLDARVRFAQARLILRQVCGKRGTGSVAQTGVLLGETLPPRCLSPSFPTPLMRRRRTAGFRPHPGRGEHAQDVHQRESAFPNNTRRTPPFQGQSPWRAGGPGKGDRHRRRRAYFLGHDHRGDGASPLLRRPASRATGKHHIWRGGVWPTGHNWAWEKGGLAPWRKPAWHWVRRCRHGACPPFSGRLLHFRLPKAEWQVYRTRIRASLA
jgi:hypothetical protein